MHGSVNTGHTCYLCTYSIYFLNCALLVYIKFISITAVLGRALAVVKVTSQVNGKTQFLGSCSQEAIGPITTKIGTIDFVGEGNPHATFYVQGVTEGFSPYG